MRINAGITQIKLKNKLNKNVFIKSFKLAPNKITIKCIIKVDEISSAKVMLKMKSVLSFLDENISEWTL